MTISERDAASQAMWPGNAGRQALERADDELGAIEEIEAGPVEVGQGVEQQGGEVGGVGDAVTLAVQQAFGLRQQLQVLRRLVADQ